MTRSVLALSALGLALGCAPSALAGSLYSGPGHRPGPDILYRPPLRPAQVPQLQNRGIWHAGPLLVSGASAYRRGEYLWQDWLYDDHGARVRADPHDPRGASDLFGEPNGTYTYPTSRGYANNAADFVELRLRRLSSATAFRITVNTLNDPSLIALSIAIGSSGSPRPFPYGANVSAPARFFLTVHPSGSRLVGDLRDAASNAIVPGGAPSVRVSRRRRQIEVRIPHAAWNPGRRVWRLAAGIGLWNPRIGQYLKPQRSADILHPGGGGASSAAFFNVAFRTNVHHPGRTTDEPFPHGTNVLDTAFHPAWWRDRRQGEALAAHDISPFHADVNFRTLAARRSRGDIPRRGAIDRIMGSHFETRQGADFSVNCLLLAQRHGCRGQFQGRLQPYSIYVPRKRRPRHGYGMTLLLHSLTTEYNQYQGTNHERQFAERGPGSIVLTPEARGYNGFYEAYTGADVFEAWADVAKRYRLNPAWTAIAGYSMGGIGTFRLAEQYPDLFARANSVVGFSEENDMIPSLRNLPLLMWNEIGDEVVVKQLFQPTAARLAASRLRHEYDLFSLNEHLQLALNDQYAPAARFLGTHKVHRNPAHVTYVLNPAWNYPRLSFVANHAYWVSGLRRRSKKTGRFGTIDVRSRGFRRRDPRARRLRDGSGVLVGGHLGNLSFKRQVRTWRRARRARKRNRLVVTAHNISRARINIRRARVRCNARVTLHTDGPIRISLTGGRCHRVIRRR